MKTGFIKKNFTTILLFIILFTGLGLIAYPSFSDYWNSLNQTKAIADYSNVVANMNDDDYEEMLQKALSYNDKISEAGIRFELSGEELEEYNETLDVTGTGIMGYIEIDKIHCSLPIYHGTDESILQTAVGHIQGSSLPVGGENSHCVLSGHRGLPSARLFTDLDKMEIGDIFVLQTLDETLTYKVDQILIVDPHDVQSLCIEKGKDYCTLITCTPYGVNSHRLLVRGIRTDNESDSSDVRIIADGTQIEPIIAAPLVAVPMLSIILIVILLDTKKNKRKRGKNEHKEIS